MQTGSGGMKRPTWNTTSIEIPLMYFWKVEPYHGALMFLDAQSTVDATQEIARE